MTTGNTPESGEWILTEKGWWFKRTDGIWPAGGWAYLTRNGLNSWYYFSEVKKSAEAMMFSNTTTPDGYAVDTDGAWIQ